MPAPELFDLDDPRTKEELAAFGHPMPKVTLELKRLLNSGVFTRLLPAISKLCGKDELDLEDIVMMCGGILVETGRKDSGYSNADKVLKMMVGKNKDEGRKDQLDYMLHDKYEMWRSRFTDLHRAAINYQFELKTQRRRAGLEPFKGKVVPGPENGGVLNPVKDWA